MIGMVDIEFIKRSVFRKGSRSPIARHLSINRITVRESSTDSVGTL